MANPAKKGGLFGPKIEFKIGSSSKRGRSSSGGGGQAPVPPPLHGWSSQTQLSAPAPTPAGNPSAATLSSPSPPQPKPPTLQEELPLPSRAPVVPPLHGWSSSRDLAPSVSQLPAPAPAPSSPSPPQPEPSTLQKDLPLPSPHPPATDEAKDGIGKQDVNFKEAATVKLLAGKRTNVQPQMNHGAIDVVTTLKFGCQDGLGKQDENFKEAPPVKLLASKRTYVQPPMDHGMINHVTKLKLGCQDEVSDKNEYQINTSDGKVQDSEVSHQSIDGCIQYSFAPQRTLGWQTTEKVTRCKSYRKRVSSSEESDDCESCSVDNSTKGWCIIRPKAMGRLDQFIHRRELTKTIEMPGTSSSFRVTNAALMETRLILRRSIRPLYKLHREEYCLEGSFGLSNFLIDDSLFINLGYRPEDRKKYSKKGACADMQRFVRMVEEDVFRSEAMPYEIRRWLSLIERAGTDYEYLVSYDSSLMEHNQVISTFMQLYSKLQVMETTDRAGYKFVLEHLKHFAGWTVCDLHNAYFIETYWRKDPKTKEATRYGSDVKSLLRLIRNTFQHIMMKRIDDNGNISFWEEDYEYIFNDQFPGLLSDFMEAMYIAAHLAELNLEHVMV